MQENNKKICKEEKVTRGYVKPKTKELLDLED